MVHRNKALVKGIVQGIGFRPYVYNLAKKHELNGYIQNTSTGVEIEVEGKLSRINQFFIELENNNLPLAHITSLEQTTHPPKTFKHFEIRESQSQTSKVTLIPPDICVCDNCLKELNNPQNRRYRYPFINCTNCGPRYTIIKDVPYDRPLTSMNVFQMCQECLREYNDPTNRRFHAQPNACSVCGPKVTLFDTKRNLISTDDPITQTAELIKSGFVVAIKGLGGFHLAVDAENNEAVNRLRQLKLREEKPLALMSLSIDLIRQYVKVCKEEIELLTSPQRPIVLLKKKIPNSLADDVAPRNKYFGVMLPSTPLHYLLLEKNFLALVMTSGNLSEEPIVINNDDAFEHLGNIADYFLTHNRDIYLRSDDSIVRRIKNQNTINRRARGFAPLPVFLHKDFPNILACGAELKNTICLTKGKNAIISQHVGDLKTEKSYLFFKQTVDHMQKLFDIKPEFVAYDLHPNYVCSQFALELENVKKIGVQHHHAHIKSCMAEHGLDGAVIGLSFDGTGYGTDGKIWGGEILLVEGANFSRLAHLEYTQMPGGDAAIKQPWRMAVSYLYQTFGENFLNLQLPFLKNITQQKIDLILRMIINNFNCPETSSMGRLFDGVSAMLGICDFATYEGQPAIMLEQWAIENNSKNIYNFDWNKENGIYKIAISSIIKNLVDELIQGKSPEAISYTFHLTLVNLFTKLCRELKKDTGLNRIVLSGGVFQNITLLTGLQNALKNESFFVYSHEKVPTNDGGISLGQAAIAEATM
jgi:hydrogenase maturation protein HypF